LASISRWPTRADLIAFCAAEVPRWDAASINGYALREAGASPPQEVAFALAGALACIARCQQRGADPAAVAPHVSLTLAVHSDFFEEIAKFRAARRLWARALRERHGVTSPAALALRLHARTAGSTLAASQPGNNAARVAVQALIATLAGARSLHASSLDEMYAAPSDESITLALRTQQIISEECRLGAVGPADPLSGSALVEQLTDRLEAEAQAELDRLDTQGGLLAAIALGHPQRALAEGRELQRRQLELGERVVVGVNRHVDLVEPRNLPTLSLDEPAQRQQTDALRRLRRERDPGLVRACLDEVSAASVGDANLLPPVIRAARALCTEQEICEALVNPG
jgi:methylmalonyl-CoA mutase, N-terminal domain